MGMTYSMTMLFVGPFGSGRVVRASFGAAAGLRCLGVLVLVVPPHPSHGPGKLSLVAAFGREIEQVVRADQDVEPARVSRISMEDGAAGVFVEGARARHLVAVDLLPSVVVVAVFADHVRRERHVVVEVEVAAERRHPFET